METGEDATGRRRAREGGILSPARRRRTDEDARADRMARIGRATIPRLGTLRDVRIECARG
jgi:hypothetical protein